MRTYAEYKRIFAGQPMPFAYVDLQYFDENVKKVAERSYGKPVRIATKSVRCVELLKRIQRFGKPFDAGLMTYSAAETVFLYEQGFDNFLLGYPCWQELDVIALCKAMEKGADITLMADSVEQLEHFNRLGEKNGVKLPICIDLDMATEVPMLYFGVRRSTVRTVTQLQTLVQTIEQAQFLSFDGLMGYEAQIAGVGDETGSFLKNRVIKQLKKRSVGEVYKRREALANFIQQLPQPPRLFNGGGTGSLESTAREPWITEVTAGSAFFHPSLFSRYRSFWHLPAAGFAIEITRRPQPHLYTCSGGGYVASGSAGKEKLPQPYLPAHARLTDNEGAGEVQTPVYYDGNEQLSLGDPIFMRHAKAGELCERFNELFLIENGQIVNRVPTYRGMGQCFL